MILGLTTAWSAAVWAEEKDPGDKMPTSVLIVNIAGKSREGISVVNRATIAKVAAFFPNYEKRPASDLAGS